MDGADRKCSVRSLGTSWSLSPVTRRCLLVACLIDVCLFVCCCCVVFVVVVVVGGGGGGLID